MACDICHSPVDRHHEGQIVVYGLEAGIAEIGGFCQK